MARTKRMEQAKTDYWLIKHIETETKRKVKSYAVLHGLTIAEALKAIIAEWEVKK
jgi:hypothetical protein